MAKFLRVWHPESPGSYCFVRRNWLEDLLYPYKFASVMERWHVVPATFEDRTKTLWHQERLEEIARNQQQVWEKDELREAEARIQAELAPQYWGSHLPERGPEHYAPRLSAATTVEERRDCNGFPYQVLVPGLPVEYVLADRNFRFNANARWVIANWQDGRISAAEYERWVMSDEIYYPPLKPESEWPSAPPSTPPA